MDWDYNSEEEKEAWDACNSYIQQYPYIIDEFLKKHAHYAWCNPDGIPYAYDIIEWKIKECEEKTVNLEHIIYRRQRVYSQITKSLKAIILSMDDKVLSTHEREELSIIEKKLTDLKKNKKKEWEMIKKHLYLERS